MKIFLLGAILFLDAAAIVLLLYRGRGVHGTLAWLFAILAFPGLGSLAYFALANPRVERTRRRHRAAHAAVAVAAPQRLAPTAEKSSTAAVVERLTDLPMTDGNQADLLLDDDQAFELVESALAEARRSIWAEYFLVRRDETGQRFLRILAEKAAEGVDVRFLYDAVGSAMLVPEQLREIRSAGGHIFAFLPVNPLRRRWSVHLRNHRKLICIDGETAFTGGMNVGDEYSGRSRRRGSLHFRDTHLRLRGPCVEQLEEVFREDWVFASGVELPSVARSSPKDQSLGITRVAIVPSGPDQQLNASQLAYFSGINEARSSLELTSPYFVPDSSILRALVAAALRGVEVKIMVPARPDVRFVASVSRSYYRELLEAGVRIFEYLPAMLHGKTMVVDRRSSLVGSANLDIRSFNLNFELSALLEDATTAQALSDRFSSDLSACREVSLQEVRDWSTARRIGAGAARLLSPLI